MQQDDEAQRERQREFRGFRNEQERRENEAMLKATLARLTLCQRHLAVITGAVATLEMRGHHICDLAFFIQQLEPRLAEDARTAEALASE